MGFRMFFFSFLFKEEAQSRRQSDHVVHLRLSRLLFKLKPVYIFLFTCRQRGQDV